MTNNKEDSESEDEGEEQSKKIHEIKIKNNLKREALEITNIIESMTQLKNKDEFIEVLKKIKTPAQLLQFLLDLIHSSKNEIRYDHEKLNKTLYECNAICPSHQDYYAKASHKIVNFISFLFFVVNCKYISCLNNFNQGM